MKLNREESKWQGEIINLKTEIANLDEERKKEKDFRKLRLNIFITRKRYLIYLTKEWSMKTVI